MSNLFPVSAQRCCAALLMVHLCIGCARYERRELNPRAELSALSERQMPQVQWIQLTPADASPPEPAQFDASDGLDDRELMAIALMLNPDLQAARAAIGESEALLIAAKTLPNPEVGIGFGLGLPGTDGFKLDTDLLLELLKPGEGSAREGVAIARIAATKAEVLAKEYDVAAETRRRAFDVRASQQTLQTLDEELGLRRQAAELIRRRQELGEANAMDVIGADLELAEIQRERRSALLELERATLALKESLGLPPASEIKLQGDDAFLNVQLADVPTEAQLDEQLLANRLDLKACQAACEIAEQELRLAVARQFMKLRAGPLFSHEGDDQDYAGISASIEIPIFDRNQAEIAERTAARDRARADYVASLHRLRAQAAAALAQLRSMREEINVQTRDVLPLLERSQTLYRSALDARELSVFEWITVQQRMLRARRAYVEAAINYRRALLDVESLSGFPLWRIASGQSGEKTNQSNDRQE